MAEIAWMDGFERWRAGDEYDVREVLDARQNVATGNREYLVKWEDEQTVDADTGADVTLYWSKPEWDSWEAATVVPQAMINRFMQSKPNDWVVPMYDPQQ